MPVLTAACFVPRCPGPAESRGRCRAHRRTTSQRGYGIEHQRVREHVKATLPALCVYGCGMLIGPGDAWHLAHRVDGRADLGYLGASCVACNERAKGGVLDRG